MNIFMIASCLALFIYAIAMPKMKGRSAIIGLCVFEWGSGVISCVRLWHFQEQWLAQVKQAQMAGYGDFFVHNTSPAQYHVLWFGLAGAVVPMLIPVLWYWLDRRKEYIASPSSQMA